MYKRHLAFSEASERRNHSEVLYLNLSKKTIVLNDSIYTLIKRLVRFLNKTSRNQSSLNIIKFLIQHLQYESNNLFNFEKDLISVGTF